MLLRYTLVTCLFFSSITSTLAQETVRRIIVQLPETSSTTRNDLGAIESAFSNFAPVMDELDPDYAKRLRELPLVVMELDAAGIAELEARGISYVSDELAIPYMDEAAPQVKAPAVWTQGTLGEGQAIAIIDTGIDTDHPAFAQRIVAQGCFSSNSPSLNATSLCPAPGPGQSNVAEDCDLSIFGCGHGTHVAGIAAGDDATFRGIAPKANIIAIKVFSRFEDMGSNKPCGDFNLPSPCALAFTSDQIEAMRHVETLSSTHSIAAVNLSLGGGKFTSACDNDNTGRRDIINALRDAGIATVAASGNEGHINAIGAPACVSSAISVGNVRKNDKVSPTSNSAFMLDLLAPGTNIDAAVVGGSFDDKSGTSMATPAVAGAFALLKSAHPNASVNDIVAALKNTGVRIKDLRNNLERPRINIAAALDTLRDTISDGQTVTSTATNRTGSSNTDQQRAIEATLQQAGTVRVRVKFFEETEQVNKVRTMTAPETKSYLQGTGTLLVEPQYKSSDLVVETTREGIEKLRQLERSGAIQTIQKDMIEMPKK